MSRPGIRQVAHDVHVAHRHQPFANHVPECNQQRLHALAEVHDLDAHREVLAQLQQARSMQVAAGAVAFHAADHRGAGDALS